jgi:hypothetical protein
MMGEAMEEKHCPYDITHPRSSIVAADTICTLMAEDIADIRKERGMPTLFTSDLVKKGWTEDQISRYGSAALKRNAPPISDATPLGFNPPATAMTPFSPRGGIIAENDATLLRINGLVRLLQSEINLLADNNAKLAQRSA